MGHRLCSLNRHSRVHWHHRSSPAPSPGVLWSNSIKRKGRRRREERERGRGGRGREEGWKEVRGGKEEVGREGWTKGQMKGERATVGRKEGEESKGGTERRKERTGNEYVNFTGHMDRKE